MLQLITSTAAAVVIVIVNIYAKNPITDKDYIHDINLDSNRRFSSLDAFKSFIKKYDPIDVFEDISKLEKVQGRNLSITEKLDSVLKGIDPTDDLLKLRVQNGNPKVLALSSRRQYHYEKSWTAPPGVSIYPKDYFSYKPRLYELMKQAIYQARNKMVIMQIMREKHRGEQMFKMGYLMSKTDNACKVFNKIAFHAYRTCHRLLNAANYDYVRKYMRFRMYELQVSHMRALHLWFQVELLTDLIIRNDIEYHESYEAKSRWNFTD